MASSVLVFFAVSLAVGTGPHSFGERTRVTPSSDMVSSLRAGMASFISLPPNSTMVPGTKQVPTKQCGMEDPL